MDHSYATETTLSLDPHGQTNQPLPQPNEHPSCHDLLIADIKARAAFGLRKYGQPLRGFNGRNTLRDAYEEVLDLAVYLRQLMYEVETAEQARINERDAIVQELRKAMCEWADGSAWDECIAIIERRYGL